MLISPEYKSSINSSFSELQKDSVDGMLVALGTRVHSVPLYDSMMSGAVYTDAAAALVSRGAILAGSSVASMVTHAFDFNDYDLFFTNSESFVDTYNMLVSLSNSDPENHPLAGYKCIDIIDPNNMAPSISKLHTVNFVSRVKGRKPIQLVKSYWFNDQEHVIKSFDITAVQFSMTSETLSFNPLGVLDVVNKRINLMRSDQAPHVTMARVIKYSERGLAPTTIALIKISEAFNRFANSELPSDYASVVAQLVTS